MKNLMKLASCGNPAKFVWQKVSPGENIESNEIPEGEKAKQIMNEFVSKFNNIATEDLDSGGMSKSARNFLKGDFDGFKLHQHIDGNNGRFEFKNKDGKDIILKYKYKGDYLKHDLLILKVDNDFSWNNITFDALADGTGNEVMLILPNQGEDNVQIRINGDFPRLTDEQRSDLLNKISQYSEELGEKINDYNVAKETENAKKRIKDANKRRSEDERAHSEAEELLEGL